MSETCGSQIRSVEEKRSEDARLNPLILVAALQAELEDGGLEVSRIAVALETPEGVQVRSSGWHGEDISPAVALLEAGKLHLLLEAKP